MRTFHTALQHSSVVLCSNINGNCSTIVSNWPAILSDWLNHHNDWPASVLNWRAIPAICRAIVLLWWTILKNEPATWRDFRTLGEAAAQANRKQKAESRKQKTKD